MKFVADQDPMRGTSYARLAPSGINDLSSFNGHRLHIYLDFINDRGVTQLT